MCFGACVRLPVCICGPIKGLNLNLALCGGYLQPAKSTRLRVCWYWRKKKKERNAPKPTSLLQNGRSRLSLNSIWRKVEAARQENTERAATHGKQESEEGGKKRRGKSARLFAPTCLDLKERGAKTKTPRRLGRLEKGNIKGENGRKRRRGRGRGADPCAAPESLVGVWSQSAGTSSRIDFTEIRLRVNDRRGRRHLILGELEGWDRSLDTSTGAEERQTADASPPASEGLGYVNKPEVDVFSVPKWSSGITDLIGRWNVAAQQQHSGSSCSLGLLYTVFPSPLPPTSPQTRTLAWLHVSSQHKKSVCILVDLFLRKNLHQGSCGNNFLLCEWKTPDEKEQVRQHPQHLCNCRGWYGVKASCGLQSSPQKKTVFPWWRGKFPAPGLRSHVPLGCGKHGNGGMRNTSFS